MNELTTRNILVPRSSMWAVIITLATALIVAWFDLQTNISRSDKEREILRLKVAHLEETVRELKRDEETSREMRRYEEFVRETNERFLSIQQSLFEIHVLLDLKQDKRFIE